MDVPILSHFTLSASSPVAEKRSKKMTSTSLTAEEQAEFLAKDVLEYLLNDTGVRINGYRTVVPGQLRDVKEERPCIRRDDFQQARLSIIHGCNHIKLNHGQDIADLCQKLDIGDEQLHANFMEALDTVWEEPRNWGRLVSLFVAAYFICERLHREGSEDKIQSVIGWLGKYLKDHTVPWVLARGGFTGVLYGTQVPNTKTADTADCKTDYNSARMGLVGIALSLGAAVVVGTIVGR